MTQVHAVVLHGARLIPVVVCRDGEDRLGYLPILLHGRVHRIPVGTGGRIPQPLLKHGTRVPHDAVEHPERQLLAVELLESVDPEARLTKQVDLGSDAAGVGEPLDDVGGENVPIEREIDTGVRRRHRHDGDQVGRGFLEDGPLIEPCVGAAPHGDLSVGPLLSPEPFDHVVSVPALVDEGLEGPLRVPPAPNVNQREDVSVVCEVHGARVVGVGDVGCEGEDHGERLAHVLRLINGGIQLDAVPHRDFDAPDEIYPLLLPRLREQGGEACQGESCDREERPDP